MNGIHDLGGMHGFGAIDSVPNEPVFHEPWEARAFALNFVSAASGYRNVDEFRHAPLDENESLMKVKSIHF